MVGVACNGKFGKKYEQAKLDFIENCIMNTLT